MTNEEMAVQGGKIAVVWAAIGITSWTQAAGFLAFILSFLALCEWVWKKVIRAVLVYYGYMAPRKVRYVEVQDE